MKPVTTKVFTITPPASHSQEIVAKGPPDRWTETVLVGITRDSEKSVVLKPICMIGAGQSQDTVMGNWSKLRALVLKSKHHIPLTLDRTSPLLKGCTTVPEMLFIQNLPGSWTSQCMARPRSQSISSSDEDEDEKENDEVACGEDSLTSLVTV
eukprot:Blabericola_migrator_1__741@NODE_1184_length_5189_cov_182_323702_g63_i1_p2_GENE_NODE_1184_length_5189_cov_182_323702_g63_i1NODE_1184_length_5189_cov_182_323702_g63_i1_p2_ORF_typecomplete_len153_score29_14_NODE_1184_length_5189_cov_182_323702_g63_i118362294